MCTITDYRIRTNGEEYWIEVRCAKEKRLFREQEYFWRRVDEDGDLHWSFAKWVSYKGEATAEAEARKFYGSAATRHRETRTV